MVDRYRKKLYNIFIFEEGVFTMSEKEYRVLQNALASVGMEGFSITNETESDCVRLLHGEISEADLAAEIMVRQV